MKIGMDIDGVILDFERTMRSYAEMYDLLILDKKGVVNNDEFNYLNRYDWTVEERRKFINEFLVYATTNSTPLIPLVKEMLKFFEIEEIDYEFITARGSLKKETKDAVIEVFKLHNIPIDKIHFETPNKVEKCIELGIDLMIDDNPDTCTDLQNNKIKTLYFRDKGNKKLEEDDYLKEVSNVGEICRYVTSINGFKNNSRTYKKVLKKHNN